MSSLRAADVEPSTAAVSAGTVGGAPDVSGRKERRRKFLLGTVMPVGVLVAMVIYFSLQSDVFLSTRNLTILSGDAGILLLSALGLTLVVVMGCIDLSVGSIILLTGAIVAELVVGGLTAPVLVVLVTIGIGAALGAINGAIYAYGRVPSFIATLGTLSLFAGAALTLIDGQAVPFDAPGIQSLAVGELIPNLENSALFGLVALALLWLLSRHTRAGVYIFAIGGNEVATRLAGVRVNRYKAFAFILAGVTAALAGLMTMAQLSSGSPDAGSAALLDALAAIVIGGTSLAGGAGGVHRTLLGVLIITVLANGLNLMGVESFTQTMIKGGVVIVAAVFTMASNRSAVVK